MTQRIMPPEERAKRYRAIRATKEHNLDRERRMGCRGSKLENLEDLYEKWLRHGTRSDRKLPVIEKLFVCLKEEVDMRFDEFEEHAWSDYH